MEVEFRKAESPPLYNNHPPQGIHPNLQIPYSISFKLDELTPGNGYHVTPMHELFIESTRKLGFDFEENALIHLNRERGSFSREYALDGRLCMKSKRKGYGHGKREDISYYRRPFNREGGISFDVLEIGEMEDPENLCEELQSLREIKTKEERLERLIQIVKSTPQQEGIDFHLQNMEMEIHTKILMGRCFSRISIETSISWVEEIGKARILNSMEGRKRGEFIPIASQILDKYIKQFKY